MSPAPGRKEGPAWLAELQATFGAMLRTPLERTTGTLRVAKTAYPPGLVALALGGPRSDGAAGLAAYNRQYWLRLFGVLAGAFPLTARLLGHWRFNAHAARFLLATPPRTASVDDVPDGFAEFFARALVPDDLAGLAVTVAGLVEAVGIDEAFRRAHFAPLGPVWRLTAGDAARLAGARLVPSPTAHIARESSPLVALRGELVLDAGEAPVPLPPPLAAPHDWAIVRRPAGVGALRLEPREAELFALLRARPVGVALAALEAACPVAERAELPARARAWLQRSVELGFWSGLEEPQK